MRNLLLSTCLTLFANYCLTQSLSPTVIASSNGSYVGATFSMDYTVGETFISTLSSGDYILTQGFHQPEFIVVDVFGCTDSSACNFNTEATVDDSSCVFPPSQPSLACYETATLNSSTCQWEVSGTQPSEPTGLACYETATFNSSTCQWEVSGTQPSEPTGLACYETATFNSSTCQWDVSGTQPSEPIGLACYEIATFNSATCSWDVTGTQPPVPTGLDCYETANFNDSTCSWVVTGTPPAAPQVVNCWDSYVFNTDSCAWLNDGEQPETNAIYDTLGGEEISIYGITYSASGTYYDTLYANGICTLFVEIIIVDPTSTGCNDETACNYDPTVGILDSTLCNYPSNQPEQINCWDEFIVDNATCLWINVGSEPLPPVVTCYEIALFDSVACQWVVTGNQPTQPNLECWQTANFNDSTCSWVVTGTQPEEPTGLACYETANFNDSTCSWVVTGTQPTVPQADNCWDSYIFNTDSCAWLNEGVQPNTSTLIDTLGSEAIVINGVTYTVAGEYMDTIYVDGTCSLILQITIVDPLLSGCQDETACNFDGAAGISDSTLCTYPGCTESGACNYDMEAGCDDGSCNFDVDETIYLFIDSNGVASYNDTVLVQNVYEFIYPSANGCDSIVNVIVIDSLAEGCLNAEACNYDATSGINIDSLCIYPGCTDPSACNFNAEAGCDDASCTYPGCNNPEACNYSSSPGCVDNEICVLPDGCTDVMACNYDSLATCDDGSCSFDVEETIYLYIDSNGVAFYNDTTELVQDVYEFMYASSNGCDSIVNVIVIDSLAEGCLNAEACNYDPTVGINMDSLCILPNGCTDMMACNYDSLATCDDGSCAYESYSTIYLVADSVTLLSGLIYMDTMYYSVGTYEYITNNTQGCDSIITVNVIDSSLTGCMDMQACNYNMYAGINDSMLCVYPGCMDMTACNYDSSAICDDGIICTYFGCTDANACNYDALASCDDGSCQQLDACGECGGNGVPGCINSMACNYDDSATCDDGSCVLPNGCTEINACNFDPTATCDDGSCEYSVTVFDTLAFDSIAFVSGVVIGSDTLFAPGTVTDTIDVANGCDTIFEHIVVLGQRELEELANVSLYPNPSNTFFQLNLGKLESRRIEIYDISSRRLYDVSQIQRGSVTFDVNNYAPGYYFMRIYLDNRIILRRFEVVR